MKKYILIFLTIFITGNIFSQGLSVDWSICYGGTEEDQSVSSCKFYNDGFIIAGDCYSEDFDVPANNGMIDFYVARIDKYGSYDIVLINVDQNGGTLWVKNYGGGRR